MEKSSHATDGAAVTVTPPHDELQHPQKELERSQDDQQIVSKSNGEATSHPLEHNEEKPVQTTNPPVSALRETLLIFLVINVQLLTQASLGQAVASQQIIARSFGISDPAQLAWFLASLSLTVGTFILVMGRVGDMYGQKNLFIIGYIWLSLWNIITGLSVYSRSAIFFDFCRAMQGLGCAILLPNSLAILGIFYPAGPKKNAAFGLFGAMAPSGFVIGALFSSLVAELAWWPWAFWLMAVWTAAMAALSVVVVPAPSEIVHLEAPEAISSFDWWGAVTGVGGLVLFSVAWNQAPTVGWNSPYVIVLLILSVLLILAFFYVERKANFPLVPLDAFSGKVGLVLACVACGWSSFGIFLWYFWEFGLYLENLEPLTLTAQLVPAILGGLAASAVVATTITRVKASYLMMASLLCFCISDIIIATNEPGRLYWKQKFWAMVFAPFGMDISFPAAALIISNSVSSKNQGMAASLVVTIVNYSMAVGLGIAGTVEIHVNDNGNNPLMGYRGAWYAAIGLSGLGVLVAAGFVISDLVGDRRGPGDAQKKVQPNERGSPEASAGNEKTETLP